MGRNDAVCSVSCALRRLVILLGAMTYHGMVARGWYAPPRMRAARQFLRGGLSEESVLISGVVICQ